MQRVIPIWVDAADTDTGEVEAFCIPDDMELKLYTPFEMRRIELAREDKRKREAQAGIVTASPYTDPSIITEDWFSAAVDQEERLTPDTTDAEALQCYRDLIYAREEVARQAQYVAQAPTFEAYEARRAKLKRLASVVSWMEAQGYDLPLLSIAEARADWDVVDWLTRPDTGSMSEQDILRTYVWTPEQRIEADDSLTDAEKQERLAELAEERSAWREKQTGFRRAQLHRAFCEWFRCDGHYGDRSVVVSWRHDDHGRWVPDEEASVKDWVGSEIRKRDGDVLSAYSYCFRIIEGRLQKRRAAAARKRGGNIAGRLGIDR